MSTNLEIEFKNLLTKVEYEQLLSYFVINKENIRAQKNIYFDTPSNALKNQKSALRIRIKEDVYELTLKIKDPQGALEINQNINHQDYLTILDNHGFVKGPVYNALHKTGITVSDLKVIASLTTKRVEFPYEGGTLFFDESFYGGTTDYEVEYEATDYNQGLKTFNDFLASHKIPSRYALPKIRRAQGD